MSRQTRNHLSSETSLSVGAHANTLAERQAAAKTLAVNAADADELREWLGMFGLTKENLTHDLRGPSLPIDLASLNLAVLEKAIPARPADHG